MNLAFVIFIYQNKKIIIKLEEFSSTIGFSLGTIL